jgi:hypothetical protein
MFQYGPNRTVCMVIHWQYRSPNIGDPSCIWLAQHLPERQPGAQAVSRAQSGAPLDTGEHLAKVGRVLSQPMRHTIASVYAPLSMFNRMRSNVHSSVFGRGHMALFQI